MANKIKIAGTTSNTFTVGTAGTGNITAGNYLYSNGQALTSGSSSSSNITIVTKSSNTVATISEVGKMIVNSTANTYITYDIPNVATVNFTVGSRFEFFADSAAGIIVGPASGSGVTIIGSSTVIANIQSAKLTMVATNRWYLGP
jgi:activator of HSP90 ATPase